MTKGNEFQTIANYDDQVSQTERQGGFPSFTCGAIAYTLEDSTGEAPNFATVATSGASLTITGSEDGANVGTHALTLRAALVSYPGIEAKDSQFTVTMTKNCLSTVVIASSEPEDMEIGVGNGRAMQVRSPYPYDDQVSSDSRDSVEPFSCGSIVLTLEDADGEEPSFVRLQLDSTQVVLILETDDEKDIGVHEISLVAILELYPEMGPMRSVFNVTITLPVAPKGKPSTLNPIPESLVQIIQGQGWRFVLTVSDFEDDFDREEVVMDGPAADAFTYDEETKTLETKAGQLPSEQPLSMNTVKITLYDHAGNIKEYTFEVEIVTQFQQRHALEKESSVKEGNPPKIFAVEFTTTGRMKIGFDRALMIPDFMRLDEDTDQELETELESETEPNARRLITEKEEAPE